MVVSVVGIAIGLALMLTWLLFDVPRTMWAVGFFTVIAGGWGLERSGHKEMARQIFPMMLAGLAMLFGVMLTITFGRLAFTLDTVVFKSASAVLAVAIGVATVFAALEWRRRTWPDAARRT